MESIKKFSRTFGRKVLLCLSPGSSSARLPKKLIFIWHIRAHRFGGENIAVHADYFRSLREIALAVVQRATVIQKTRNRPEIAPHRCTAVALYSCIDPSILWIITL